MDDQLINDIIRRIFQRNNEPLTPHQMEYVKRCMCKAYEAGYDACLEGELIEWTRDN